MDDGDATTLIHQVSRGLPRAINNLAIQVLIAAYATNKTIVDESSTRTREAWQQALDIFEDLGHPDAGKVYAKLAGLDDNPPDMIEREISNT